MYDAVTLDACLRNVSSTVALPKNFSRGFYEKQAARTRDMWQSTKDRDYMWSGTTRWVGDDMYAEDGKFRRLVMGQIMRLCPKDPQVYSSLWHVMALLAPPTDLFAPWLCVRVARQYFFG